jgi:predicted lipoprotein with Yx(FWY)xxD motif
VASVINADWSIIDAGTGRKQYAYKGKPLYLAAASMSDWEIAKAGGWETVVYQKSAGRPSEIKQHLTLLGDVYTTKDGLTLYNYGCGGGGGIGGGGVPCDDPGDAAGYMVALCGVAEECAKRWHPYLAPANARPVGEWSIATITYPMFTDPRGALYPPDAPRAKAWAYRGKPVFTYYDDKKPGDIWGNGTRGLWGSSFSAVSVPGHSAMFE